MRRMHRWIVAALAMIGSASTTRGGEVPAFARSGPEVRSGPALFAFNGRDLAGFYRFTRFHKLEDPAAVFTVADGMIRISGAEPGSLTTVREFSDYHLIVEWRWGRETYPPRRWRARNSGVLVHCVGQDGDGLGAWMESIECQILEGGTGDLILVPGQDRSKGPSFASEVRSGPDGQPYYEKGGQAVLRRGGRLNWWGRDPDWSDVLWFRGRRDVDAPVGDWNRTEVVCDGDRVSYRLNGVLVNAATGSSLKAGKILLQSEGAEIFFRKFEVHPLIR